MVLPETRFYFWSGTYSVAFCIDLDLLQVLGSACKIKLSEKGGIRISSLLVLIGLKFALGMKLLSSVETETLPCVFRSRTLNVWKSSVYEAWWVDLSQMPTQRLSHSPFSAGQKENKLKKLMGQDREIAYQLPSLAKQTRLGENKFVLLSINRALDGEKQRQIKTTPPPPPSDVGGWGMGGCGQPVTALLCHSFLLAFFPCSPMGPSHGLQSFRINLLWPGVL